MEGARSKAEALLRDHLGCTRRPIVYAVTAAGRSAPVEQEAKTVRGLSGTQISRLAALTAGTTAARPSSKDTAIRRFLKSTEQLLPATRAYAILAMPFDTAKAEIAALLPVIRSEMPDPSPLAQQTEGAKQSGLEARKKAVISGNYTPLNSQTKTAGPMSKRAILKAAVERGILPEPLDLTADTCARFSKRLAALVELAQKGDLDGPRLFTIIRVSSSPNTMDQYRKPLYLRA